MNDRLSPNVTNQNIICIVAKIISHCQFFFYFMSCLVQFRIKNRSQLIKRINQSYSKCTNYKIHVNIPKEEKIENIVYNQIF